MSASQKAPKAGLSRAEKARMVAEKYSGAGQTFRVKYLGTQEVSSAKGDAVAADCLKEMRSFVQGFEANLPKVAVTLQFSGITVLDEKSQMETLIVPLDCVSYVCLDPGDNSIFSFIVYSTDTISSKGLRLHAFKTDPQTAITFNRSARELFDFMVRLKRAKKKLAQQTGTMPSEQEHTQLQSQDREVWSQEPLNDFLPQIPPPLDPPPLYTAVQVPPPELRSTLPEYTIPPVPTPNTPPEETVIYQVPSNRPVLPGPREKSEEEKRKAVFEEWKNIEKDLSDIAGELGIGPLEPTSSIPPPSTPTPPSYNPTMGDSKPSQSNGLPPTPFEGGLTTSGGDPFDSSFFDLSFGDSRSTASSVKTSTPSHAPHFFDNPVFSGYSDTSQVSTTSTSAPLTSTPEAKKETYACRPRPKSKHPVDDIVPSMNSPAASTNTQLVEEVDASKNLEDTSNSVMSNTDPFQSLSMEPFQPRPVVNGGSLFPTQSETNSTSFFSPLSGTSQGSIQLVNPLYQSQSFDSSFSSPYAHPGPVMQPQGIPMQPQGMYIQPLGIPVQHPMMTAQPQMMYAQPPVIPAPAPAVHAAMQMHTPPIQASPPLVGHQPNMVQSPTPLQPLFSPQAVQSPFSASPFGGSMHASPFSPPLASSPFENIPVASPSFSLSSSLKQSPAKAKNETDGMFADLIPAGALGSEQMTKKKAFDPPKLPRKPSLQKLQEDTLRWTAFEGNEEPDKPDTTIDEKTVSSEWPSSPFDDVFTTDNSSGFDTDFQPPAAITEQSEFDAPPKTATNNEPPSTAVDEEQQNTGTSVVEDFDATFNKVDSKQHDIESAFVVKYDAKPQTPTAASTAASTSATNDPFAPTQSLDSSKEQPSEPWVYF